MNGEPYYIIKQIPDIVRCNNCNYISKLTCPIDYKKSDGTWSYGDVCPKCHLIMEA